MGTGKQRLTVEVETKGGDPAAQELKKVDRAQRDVVDTTRESVKPTEAASDATKKATASTEDFTSAASRIHPVLGAYMDGMVKATRIAGEFANAQLHLGDVIAGVRSVIGKFANTLKLLGAVGVVIAGIKALTAAIGAFRDEMERANAAQRAFIQAQREADKAAKEAAEGMAQERDKMGRKRPWTFQEQETIRETMAAAPEAMREQIKPIVEAVGGAAGFGAGAGPFTGGQLEQLATLGFEPVPEASQEYNRRQAERLLKRRRDDLAAIEERKRQQRAATTEHAAREALAGDLTGIANLEAITGPLAAQYGLDPDEFLEIAQSELGEEFEFQKGLEGMDPRQAGLRKWLRGRYPSQRIREKLGYVPGLNERGFQGTPYVETGQGSRPATLPELTALTEVFRRLLPAIERMANEPSTVIHQHHPRNYDSGAQHREEARTGGQFARDALQIG